MKKIVVALFFVVGFSLCVFADDASKMKIQNYVYLESPLDGNSYKEAIQYVWGSNDLVLQLSSGFILTIRSDEKKIAELRNLLKKGYSLDITPCIIEDSEELDLRGCGSDDAFPKIIKTRANTLPMDLNLIVNKRQLNRINKTPLVKDSGFFGKLKQRHTDQ